MRTPRFSLISCLFLLKEAASSRARRAASVWRAAAGAEASRQRQKSSAAARSERIWPSRSDVFISQNINTARASFVARLAGFFFAPRTASETAAPASAARDMTQARAPEAKGAPAGLTERQRPTPVA